MKLPTDPKTRLQVLFIAAVGVILLLALGYLGLSSLTAQRAATRIRLSAAIKKLSEIDREVQAMPALRKSRDDLFASIQEAGARHILFHEYRNYQLTARDTLVPMATAFGITVDIPREGVVQDLPISESKATDKAMKAAGGKGSKDKDYSGPISSTFSLFTVTLTGKAGFVPLLAFLARIEESNPYLTVSDLSIQANPGSVESHSFTLTLLWPIWKNLELKPKTEDLIQDYAPAPENP